MDMKTIGKWALVAGIALALINAFVDLGLGENSHLVAAILGLLGGILYLSTDDATNFYILTAAVAATASMGAMGGPVSDLFGLGQFVTDWMIGSTAVLTAAAVALIVRNFVGWAKP